MPFFASCSCSISLHLFSLMRDIIIIMRAALVSYYVLKLMYEEFSFFFRRVLALIWNVSRGISGNRDQSSHSGRKAVIINCVNENKKRVRFHLWVPCFCIWHHKLNTVALAQPLQIVRSYILTWMCAFFLSFVCHNTYFFWHHTISKKIMPLNTCVRAFWQQTASTVTQPKQNLLVAFINRMMESFSVMRKMKASCYSLSDQCDQ